MSISHWWIHNSWNFDNNEWIIRVDLSAYKEFSRYIAHPYWGARRRMLHCREPLCQFANLFVNTPATQTSGPGRAWGAKTTTRLLQHFPALATRIHLFCLKDHILSTKKRSPSANLLNFLSTRRCPKQVGLAGPGKPRLLPDYYSSVNSLPKTFPYLIFVIFVHIGT